MTILENFLQYLILHDKLPKWFKKYINNRIKNELENKKVLNYLKQLSLNEIIELFSDKKINDDNYKNILKSIITYLIENNLINKNISDIINQNNTSTQDDTSKDDTTIKNLINKNIADIINQNNTSTQDNTDTTSINDDEDNHSIKCDKSQAHLNKLINYLYTR